MSSGSIRYYAESKELELKEFKMDHIRPEVEEITIKTENSDQLMVAILSFKDGCSKEQAVGIGDELVNILFDRISVEQNIPIGELRREISVWNIDESTIHSSNEIGISCTFEVIKSLSENSLNKLKERLQADCERNFYFSSYRFAVRQKDLIAKFMLLYNLLLAIVGDNQKKADELIEKYQPNVQKTQSPHNQNISETIYTRLRNEIAHKREGCFPEKTRNEINSLVGNFQFILKQAVLDFSEETYVQNTTDSRQLENAPDPC
jgi:hypothetical protein